jgi:fibronectin-binding autotransporter adhesin
MALVQWTSTSSGDWATAADWSSGALPGPADTAQIEVANVTVSVSSGTFTVGGLTTNLSTLSVDGGTLTVSGTGDIGGAFLESSGVFNLAGAHNTFGTTADQSGGLLTANGGLLTALAGFTEAGGTFDIGGNGAVFDGTLAESAGNIDFTGNLLTSETSFAQTGGTLTLGGSSLFYGNLQQSSGGLIYETGGVLTDDGSFAENGGGLVLDGSGAVFNGATSIASGTITQLTGGFVANDGLTMSGGLLQLAGNGATFYGTVTATSGQIALYGGSINSYGAFIENGGQLSLGDFGGTFNNLTLQSGSISSTAPTLQVNGTYTQTGGMLAVHGRDATFAGPFSESSGATIDVLSGALQLEGSGTIAGTVTGPGRILVQGGTTTIASTAVLTGLSGISVAGGTLVYATGATVRQYFGLAPQGQLATYGKVLTLAGGAALDGEIVGVSLVYITAGASVNGLSLDGTSRLTVGSVVNQTGGVSMANASGSRTQLDINSKGVLRITGNWGVFDQSQNGLLNNAGSLIKTAGSGVAAIETNVVSSGLIGINAGTLLFGGPNSSFGGSISGAGTFAIGGTGQNSFSSTLSLSAARFILEAGTEQLTLTHNLSYGGEWSQIGGTLWLNGAISVTTGGETGLDGGLVTGSGTFSTAKIAAANISNIDFEGTSTLNVAGAIAQTSSVGFGGQVGSAPNLNIATTAVWTIENNASLGGQLNNPTLQNATITNSGTMQKLNGNANSNIVGHFTNLGTLTVADSQITLNGTGTLGGTLTGNGSLALSGTYLLASGLATSIGQIDTTGGNITLGENLTDPNVWAQTGGTVSLGTNTLTVSGLTSLEGGFLNGPGTLVAAGNTYLGDNYAIGIGTLVVSSHATQLSDITVGDWEATGAAPQAGLLPPSLATVVVAAGATYTLADSNSIFSNGTLAVAGTFTAQGSGSSVIGPSVIDTGAILDNSAALRFIGPVSGTGSIVIGAGGSLDFVGSVAASTTVSFNSASASMFLEDPFPGTNNLTFAGQVAGFGSGDFIEFANLSQNLSQLTLTLNGGSTGTVATIADQSGNSDSITFTATQTLSALTIGFGSHGDIALFHL